jgi:hypothetical protein
MKRLSAVAAWCWWSAFGLLSCATLASCDCRKVTPVQQFSASFLSEQYLPGSWQSMAVTLSGSPKDAWSAALSDASATPTEVGVVVLFSPDGTTDLDLVIPFPLHTGDSLTLSTMSVSTAASFTMSQPASDGSAPLGASASLYCSDFATARCLHQNMESFNGTLTVTSASPLGVRVDATVSYGNAAGNPMDTVSGNVSFVAGPVQQMVETGCYD